MLKFVRFSRRKINLANLINCPQNIHRIVNNGEWDQLNKGEIKVSFSVFFLSFRCLILKPRYQAYETRPKSSMGQSCKSFVKNSPAVLQLSVA